VLEEHSVDNLGTVIIAGRRLLQAEGCLAVTCDAPSIFGNLQRQLLLEAMAADGWAAPNDWVLCLDDDNLPPRPFSSGVQNFANLRPGADFITADEYQQLNLGVTDILGDLATALEEAGGLGDDKSGLSVLTLARLRYLQIDEEGTGRLVHLAGTSEQLAQREVDSGQLLFRFELAQKLGWPQITERNAEYYFVQAAQAAGLCSHRPLGGYLATHNALSGIPIVRGALLSKNGLRRSPLGVIHDQPNRRRPS